MWQRQIRQVVEARYKDDERRGGLDARMLSADMGSDTCNATTRLPPYFARSYMIANRAIRLSGWAAHLLVSLL